MGVGLPRQRFPGAVQKGTQYLAMNLAPFRVIPIRVTQAYKHRFRIVHRARTE